MDERAARPGRTAETRVLKLDGATRTWAFDDVAGEEPLELRLLAGGAAATLAITMRTPGNDFELAAGFVFGEGIVRARAAIAEISYCIDPAIDAEQRYNIVNVALAAPRLPDLQHFERHFTVGSSCGVCGRAQLQALRDLGAQPLRAATRMAAAQLYDFPAAMRAAQKVFASTGGLHAATLFACDGTPLVTREDVGRHNAVDKVVGWALIDGRIPLSAAVLMVSGRASYEIVQKSIMAGIPIVASVSAPSSLAVDLAREFNVTLVGFVRDGRANVYAGAERILAPD